MGFARPFVSLLLFLLVLSPSNPFLIVAVSADQIFTSSSGVAFGRSSREPKYDIEFHSTDSPFHPKLQENGQESVVMTNKEGQNYMCFLPKEEETKTVRSIIQQNSSNVIVESDRRIKLKTPDELLDVLKDQCFYRHEGWWSYEFCYHRKIRQIHLEDNEVVQEFVLGEFDPDGTAAHNQKDSDAFMLKDPRSRDASQRYHAHQYTNGTTCDLTDQPRETEVRFVCAESPVIISSIKEISSCKYVVTVQSPMLCKHPMYQQERPTRLIHCNQLPADAKDSVENSPKVTQITLATEESESYAT
ncbi:protein OS-9 homolog isoform X1 [Ananas comosus]|uniref:Protein OS-9 homolog n=1 Tax=Ananas comosus TaxID=4615 RepID=A0A6P5GMS1_ANACO|nr:protein OS-9 homolog isoform X1 [Ananas comosus]